MDDDILLWHVSFDIERPLIRTYVHLVPKNPGLQNGWNRWATDEELPKQVVRLLREGIGIMR